MLIIGAEGFRTKLAVLRLLLAPFIPPGVVKILGVLVGLYAYRSAANRKFHNAGVLAIVSSLLPPLVLVIFYA
jgi:hypothetical protein